MQLSPAQQAQIVAEASRHVAEAIIAAVDLEDFVTLPMDMVEQSTGLGATQIARRMTVRSLSDRKKGVSLKELNRYLRSIETPPTASPRPASAAA